MYCNSPKVSYSPKVSLQIGVQVSSLHKQREPAHLLRVAHAHKQASPPADATVAAAYMAAPPDAMAAWLAHTQSRVQAQKLVAAGRPAARAAEPTGGACTATTPTVIGWVHQGALAVPSAAVPAATSAWRTLGTSTVPPLAQLRALHADGVELAPAWMQALRAGGPV